jgi:hypothetical protein
MDKNHVKHYILATLGNTAVGDYRQNAIHDVVRSYDALTERVIHAFEINGVENPRDHITYSFRMLGGLHENAFNRKEIVEVDYATLREDHASFPWEQYGWVQVWQPLIDIYAYTVVEIDSEYQSFGQISEQSADEPTPFHKIYEGGHTDNIRGDFTRERPSQKEKEPNSFFSQYLAPVGKALKENSVQIAGVVIAGATLFVMARATNVMIHDLEAKTLEANEVLRHIEDMVDDALDMPQVVKVELGDDIEVIGHGRHTW